MKRYTPLTRAPELEPHHQIQFSVIPRTLLVCMVSFFHREYNQHILSYMDWAALYGEFLNYLNLPKSYFTWPPRCFRWLKKKISLQSFNIQEIKLRSIKFFCTSRKHHQLSFWCGTVCQSNSLTLQQFAIWWLWKQCCRQITNICLHCNVAIFYWQLLSIYLLINHSWMKMTTFVF